MKPIGTVIQDLVDCSSTAPGPYRYALEWHTIVGGTMRVMFTSKEPAQSIIDAGFPAKLIKLPEVKP